MGHRGFFIIRPFINKTIFKLKGEFDNNNVQWLNKAMITSKSFHNKCLELDMKEVQDINIQALSFLTATLKKLDELTLLYSKTEITPCKSFINVL